MVAERYNEIHWNCRRRKTKGYILITSVSMYSRSFKLPDAFKTGGGFSKTPGFLFFEKKLPKNPSELLSCAITSALGSLAGSCVAGELVDERGFFSRGSTGGCGGGALDATTRSFTIAIA